MPTSLTYPGVYVEEIPSGVRTIAGVGTSITAFVGAAARGPSNEPVVVNGFADYQRAFGGLAANSAMSYAVRDYFLNGGSQAIIVRLDHDGTRAEITADGGGNELALVAASPGAWGNALSVTVDHGDLSENSLFNMTVEEEDGPREQYFNLSTDETGARYVARVLEGSALVRVDPDAADPVPAQRPAEGTYEAADDSGGDGDELDEDDYSGDEGEKTGIFALEKADLFNLLCVPPPTLDGETSATVYQTALAYCFRRRAVLLVDPGPDWVKSGVEGEVANLNLAAPSTRNAAFYFPRLKQADPLLDGATGSFVPSGAVAGVIARTDATRGVWKAPAGIDAGIAGTQGLTINLTDGENGELNPAGINCLRTFPAFGTVVWGARTMRGADQAADEYKYLPVRRLALFLEESLYRGTQWVVFEPNDEPLWSQIRLNIGAFMQNLFRQGAFQGKTPADAYFVKCDKTTTTQNDINLGVVNILVGFAPLKPAEFVVIKIQQMAGQVEA
jgi:phage tail sheath protein FI